MKRLLTLGLCAITCLASCDKERDNRINGKIVNAKTGLPIDSVLLDGGFADNRTYEGRGYFTIYTDEEGKFFLEYPEDNTIINLFIRKSGYLIKNGFGDYYTDTNTGEPVLNMYPVDAFLRLYIENNSGQHDSIFIGTHSPLTNSENAFSKGILISYQDYDIALNQGEKDTVNIVIPSEEKIQIYWGFKHLHPIYLQQQAQFRDTIFLNQQDTTTYTLSF